MGEVIVFLFASWVIYRFFPERKHSRTVARVERVSEMEREAALPAEVVRDASGSDQGWPQARPPNRVISESEPKPTWSPRFRPGMQINVGYKHRIYRCTVHARNSELETHVCRVNSRGDRIRRTAVHPKPIDLVIAELARTGRVRA